MPNWFNRLKEEDIEEKLTLEAKAGRPLKETRELLKIELFCHEREILKTKDFIYNLPWYEYIFRNRAIRRELLKLEIQAQNLIEQIAYINKKLSEDE